MKRHVLLSLPLFLCIAGMAFGQNTSMAFDPAKVTEKIIVAAAANIATVSDALKTAFVAKYPSASIDFVFGASGALTTQIQNGAPFQLFLSADLIFPKKVFDAGLALDAPKVYATGKLILLSTRILDFKKGLAVLADPGITQFALANPEIAPYGKAAREALTKASFWDQVKSKVVTAQTITQALQFTLGATGIGFVNKSALYTKELAVYADKEGSNWIEVDPASHAPIAQAFVVLKSARANQTALAFAAFLASPEARAIFLKAGYAVP